MNTKLRKEKIPSLIPQSAPDQEKGETMKLIKVNPNNEQYYSKEFIRGFNLGAERQYEADIADIPTWIPCSERLPKDVQIGDRYPTVIFCTKENTYTGFYEYYLDGRWWSEDGDYVVDDVIAWMPLPEPWKGGR